jgi:hypothetical protein
VNGIRLKDGRHETMPAGSYGRDEHGRWESCSPNGRRGLLCDHTVEEHADGTITVAPSIQIDPLHFADGRLRRAGWHGYLERGVWREC